MATPVGHALAGCAMALCAWPRLTAPRLAGAVVLSNLPDLDLLAGLAVPGKGGWHHAGTHSLAFAAAVSVCFLLVGVIQDRRGLGWAWPALGAALVLAHIGVDLVTLDVTPPIGLRLFWPFDGSWVSVPFHLFDRVPRSPLGWPLVGIWMRLALEECAVLAWPLALALAWRRKGVRHG
jgi:membrane-bound metal-dependent hydrolase YbcI (DUF457 family)